LIRSFRRLLKDALSLTLPPSLLQVLDSVRGLDVYIFQSCNQPVNDRIIELLLLVSTMHRASAKRVTAVIPFMVRREGGREGGGEICENAR